MLGLTTSQIRELLSQKCLRVNYIVSSMWIYALCGLAISQIRDLLSQKSLRVNYIESIWVNSTIF